jgi:hypothetical protein
MSCHCINSFLKFLSLGITKSILFPWLFFNILTFAPFSAVHSQFTNKGEKSPAQVRRDVKKMKKENDRAAKRAEAYGRKRHLAIQDKATRKRMKKHLKQANKSMRGR